jgi:hypothetical protein
MLQQLRNRPALELRQRLLRDPKYTDVPRPECQVEQRHTHAGDVGVSAGGAAVVGCGGVIWRLEAGGWIRAHAGHAL